MRENLWKILEKGSADATTGVGAERFSIENCGSVTAVSLTQLSPATSFLRHLLSCTCFDLASFA